MLKPYLSIRSKLFFSILLTLFVSYAILLSTSVSNLDSFLENEVRKDLEASLNIAHTQYFSRANQIKLALQLPARSTTIQSHLRTGDRQRLLEAMNCWRTSLPFMDVLAIVDSRQRVICRLNSDQNGDILALPAILERSFREKQPVIATELVSGQFLQREGQHDSRGPSFPGGEAMMITIVIPVVSKAGELLGGIVAGDIVNRDTFYPYQVEKIFGRAVLLTITQKEQKIAGNMKSDVGSAVVLEPEIVATLTRGTPYWGDIRVGEKLYKTAFEALSDSRGSLAGSLSVALSKEDFNVIRTDNERNILVSALIGILLSFGIAYAAARHIARPLKALCRGVKKIEEGDLDQQVAVTAGGDLGMLADSFNRMAKALGERDNIIRRKNLALHELNELLEKKVTERTAEFRMEKERLETVLTSMVEGIVVTDRENRVILFNQAAQQLFDLVPHRVVNQPLEKLYKFEGFAGLANSIDAVRASGACSDVREEELEAHGKKLKVNLSPLLDEAEAFAGVVMSIRDVTVEEAVDRMKTEFISTVSHELKTPLTSIKGSLQFVMNKGKSLTETERELLTICLRNTERLIRLISDILDVSKIEEGGAGFNCRPQSVTMLVTYASEEIKPLAMERSITIIHEVGGDLPPIYGDHDRLVQVITNLLSNAVKFSPQGKVITVSAAREGNYVAISVADHGQAIQGADRDKLFRKFQRLENSESGERGGTGLGLAICKEVVERHHGRIYYHSGLMGGNIFTFTIPVYEEHHE